MRDFAHDVSLHRRLSRELRFTMTGVEFCEPTVREKNFLRKFLDDFASSPRREPFGLAKTWRAFKRILRILFNMRGSCVSAIYFGNRKNLNKFKFFDAQFLRVSKNFSSKKFLNEFLTKFAIPKEIAETRRRLRHFTSHGALRARLGRRV